MPTKVEINAKALEALERRIGQAYTVKVGVLSNAGNHDHISMVELAAVHEFGSPQNHIPERSFIRATFNEKRSELERFVGAIVKRMFADKNMTPLIALNILGAWMAAQIQNKITQGPHIPPPLKPATVAAKGSSRPLVDTGRLVQSITHEVVKGEG